MELEVSLAAHLEANSAVADLVDDRIYPQVVPQADADEDFYPCITYFRVSSQPLHTHESAGFDRTRMQLDCWSYEHQEARSVAQAVRGALDHFSGAMGNGSPTPATVRSSILLDSDRDLGFEDEAGLYRVSLDLFIWHEEAA